MEQIEIFSIPSPCKGICQVNNKGYCLGCFRNRDERFHWNQLSNGQKKRVITLCQQRYKRALQNKQRQIEASQQSSFDFGEQNQLDF